MKHLALEREPLTVFTAVGRHRTPIWLLSEPRRIDLLGHKGNWTVCHLMVDSDSIT